jgi:O-antigen/teichoic acid export membrane protein
MTSARKNVRNLSLNWLGYVANLVVMFLLSPFVVHTLGEVAYGIWSLLTVLTGYMGACDIGIRASTGRYVVLYLGREDHKNVEQTIQTSLGLFSILGAVLILAGLVLGVSFPYFFPSTPPEYHRIIIFLLTTLAANLWLLIVGQVFSTILVAHDRFDLARGVDLGVLAVRAAGTIMALKWGYGIVGLTVVSLLCSSLTFFAIFTLARRVYPILKAWPPRIFRPRLKELLGYGIWAALNANAGRIMNQTDMIIVGALVSVSGVTVYSVGAMLIYYSDTILSRISATFFPPLQRAVARNDKAAARWYYARQLNLALIVGIPMFVGYAIFGDTFIGLWMGHPTEFPEASVTSAAMVMAVLSFSKLIYLPAFGGEPLMAAADRIRLVSLASLVQAVVNLGLSVFFVLVLKWGIVGVAAGTLVSQGLVRIWVIPWQAFREVGWPLRVFLEIVARSIAACGCFVLWSLLVRNCVHGESWTNFALQVALALVGYAPIAFLILVTASDRKRIVRMLSLASG